MANIPDKIPMPSRTALRDRFLRDYSIYNPKAGIGPHSQPHIDAQTIADQLIPLYAHAASVFDSQNLDNMSERKLEALARDLGLPPRLPPVGASGFVLAETSAGGAEYLEGDELRTKRGVRYRCAATALYGPGSRVPVVGIDTGTITDQEPGTVLTWQQQRVGSGPLARVDSDGLIGGRAEETVDELRARIRYRLANPPASGNNADYEQFVEQRIATVAVEKCFTYSSLFGPGSMGVAFTLRPLRVGGSRIPNAAQRALVLAALTQADAMPASDSVFMAAILEEPVDLRISVNWMRGAASWADAVPWPQDPDPGGPFVLSAASATTFVLDGVSAPEPPSAGKSIAFFDKVKRTFVRKKIASATCLGAPGVDPWEITCAVGNAQSDEIFVPPIGAGCCPWSDSLQSLVEPVLTHFDTLGPGEQRAPDAKSFDQAFRWKRHPESPGSWPSMLTTRLAEPIFDLPSIQDVVVVSPTLPFTVPDGTPGQTVYLFVLGELLAFPRG